MPEVLPLGDAGCNVSGEEGGERVSEEWFAEWQNSKSQDINQIIDLRQRAEQAEAVLAECQASLTREVITREASGRARDKAEALAKLRDETNWGLTEQNALLADKLVAAETLYGEAIDALGDLLSWGANWEHRFTRDMMEDWRAITGGPGGRCDRLMHPEDDAAKKALAREQKRQSGDNAACVLVVVGVGLAMAARERGVKQ
jgi:hypothetical protein